MPIDKRGVRDVGRIVDGKFKFIHEMIPILVVPEDLTDCKLKPYVTYKTPNVIQDRFKSQDLFNAIYAKKIIDDYKLNQLDEEGESLRPSEEEQLTPEEAWLRARKTGSDIF
jgi:large subunit ribosomal protein L41